MEQLRFETVAIELTKSCNLTCDFCYACAITDSKIDKINIPHLKNFLVNFRKNGGRRVLFTGGEIFLVEELHDLILYAREQGLLVDLFSNGTLINEEDAKFIREHVNLINISVDGPEENHDLVRGSKGSYRRTLKTLEMLGNHGAHVSIQCMITPANINNMNWLKEISEVCDPLMIKLGHVSEMGRGADKDSLHLQEVFKLKELAMDLTESFNHFHTRVTTNVISNTELKVFYPSFDHMVTPWLLSDGRLMTCYVNKYKDYWTLSTIDQYPNCKAEGIERRDVLVKKAYEKAENLQYFDILELLSKTGEEIAVSNMNRIKS